MNRRQQQSKPVFIALLLVMALGACTAINVHQKPPSDWPKLNVSIHKVGFRELQKICGGSYAIGLLTQYMGCAWIYFEKGTCEVYYAADDKDSATHVIEHEVMHCEGYDHIGSSALADGWGEWKASQRRAEK